MQIKIDNLSYTYLVKTPNEVEALRDVNLEIPEGKITAIIGHTGSGKSTLIQTLNGLIIPSKGQVNVGNFQITPKKNKNKNIKKLRKSLAIVFQFPEYQLFEETVVKDVAFGLKNYGVKETDAIKEAHKALNIVGIDESFYKRSPFELSGGEKRRVAIAGIIALKPDILVLDEPTAGLDPEGSKIILDLIKELNSEGKTIILVTHDMNIVLNYSDHVVVLNEGQLSFEGEPANLFVQDVSKYSIEVPELFKFCLLLKQKGLDIDISKIRNIDDLLSELRRERWII